MKGPAASLFPWNGSYFLHYNHEMGRGVYLLADFCVWKKPCDLNFYLKWLEYKIIYYRCDVDRINHNYKSIYRHVKEKSLNSCILDIPSPRNWPYRLKKKRKRFHSQFGGLFPQYTNYFIFFKSWPTKGAKS